MQKYSIFSLIKNAFSNHQNWEVAWKDPEPKKEYDAVIGNNNNSKSLLDANMEVLSERLEELARIKIDREDELNILQKIEEELNIPTTWELFSLAIKNKSSNKSPEMREKHHKSLRVLRILQAVQNELCQFYFCRNQRIERLKRKTPVKQKMEPKISKRRTAETKIGEQTVLVIVTQETIEIGVIAQGKGMSEILY